MEWYLISFLALLLMGALVFWLARKQQVQAERVGLDSLETRLGEFGVDPGDDPTPPVELLRLHIQKSDSIIAATRARCDDKMAILALLDDRLVFVAATVGRVGSQAQAISYDRISDVESQPNVGGTLRLETDGGPLVFTHIPLENLRNIRAALLQRIRGESSSRHPLRPAAGPAG